MATVKPASQKNAENEKRKAAKVDHAANRMAPAKKGDLLAAVWGQ